MTTSSTKASALVSAANSNSTEEITRLGSHMDQLAKELDSEGSVGRKLDFLLQEIQREFNTVGAKANNLEISKKVIEAKDEVARLREQAMNVE